MPKVKVMQLGSVSASSQAQVFQPPKPALLLPFPFTALKQHGLIHFGPNNALRQIETSN